MITPDNRPYDGIKDNQFVEIKIVSYIKCNHINIDAYESINDENNVSPSMY